ncbi:DUF485 domain-containing protein [Verrucosispora sp. WMMA2044]|uniref:DUF485 domain-containing protein n=1 Tax=Verrucosispora sp. WMMA2044 TaxID=3016419 RepID=UPI00248CD323|nr:DUF485 domain-containing protein [Verrucosispora sp. WMMA2044]WBB50426.1 DUF485 domain-containing protein [Verrucosispora sp. WMMA2044]
MAKRNSPSNSDRYSAVHDSAQFTVLRRNAQTFTLRACVAFTGWWFLAILLGAYAPGFYRRTIVGSFNVGLLFVLVTFALVLAITVAYLKYARTRLDPLADEIRAEFEGNLR